MSYNPRDDKPKEECGVFGIFDNDGFDCAKISYYALYALQHRGQESCGIAVNDDGTIICHKDMGLVPEVFNDTVLNHLKGQMAVGHVRYSTTGSSVRENAQPLVSKYKKGTLTIAHNGNLINAMELRQKLEDDGAIFQTSNDSEVIAFLTARERIKCHSVEAAISNVMHQIKGSYALVIMSPSKLIGVRDPYGIRPLCLGKLENSYIFASETCALDAIGAEFVRELEPGEIVVVSKEGVTSVTDHISKNRNICIFEYIYFARPDSMIEGTSVYKARKIAGEALAKEHPVEADLVIGVPDSGLCAAIGYSEASGIPYGYGLIKNRYIGRTFIQPTQDQRQKSVQIKLNALQDAVDGKRIVMVDDSIVRGTTIRNIVRMLKKAGAKEVHVRISSPPFKWPCYFGTDIPSKSQLIACSMTNDQIRDSIEADSLGYLGIDALRKMVLDADCNFCDGCFTGNYPMEVPACADEAGSKKEARK